MPLLSGLRQSLKTYLLPRAERMVYANRQSRANVYFQDKLRQALREMEALYASRFGTSLPDSPHRIDLLTELLGTSASEAFHLLHHLNACLTLPGDVGEFGVAQGATSVLLANELLTTTKKLWLFDSFEGLPAPTEKDILKDDIFGLGSMAAYQGTMRSGPDEVTDRLRRLGFPDNRTELVAGFIEQTIHQPNLPAKLCFAYVDFDFYEPIQLALAYIDRVLADGGCIIVDDYGWFSTGAQTAVDEFIEQTNGRYQISIPDPVYGHFCILTHT